jgi:hypothetical protein
MTAGVALTIFVPDMKERKKERRATVYVKKRECSKSTHSLHCSVSAAATPAGD